MINYFSRLKRLFGGLLFAAGSNLIPAQEQVLGAEYGAYQDDAQGHPTAIPQALKHREVLSLAGDWTVTLDPKQEGIRDNWQELALIGRTIALPGTLDDAGIGEPMKPSRFVLTRKSEYIGSAWYQRVVDIPEQWRGKRMSLLLERVMWESRVWIDGQLAGSQDSLVAPHVHDLTERLTPGRHRLTIRVDNRARAGANSHGYGENIQIRWNGILGRLELSARDTVSISSLQTYPDVSHHRFRTVALVVNQSGVTVEGQISFQVRQRGQTALVVQATAQFKAAGDSFRVERFIDLGSGMKLWDEFHPDLYDLTATIDGKAEGAVFTDTSSVVFGLRELGTKGTQLTLNGRTIFLRGTHDGGSSPLDGHPPLTVEGWRRIFRICRDFGLNHVRYHSFCPPEAAFIAADEEGILLQVELPYWGSVPDDWAGTVFLRQELDQILASYGNHPSFILMSMGNEHSGDWDTLAALVDHAKRIDPRHFYTAASNAYKHPDLPVNSGDEFAAIMWGNKKNGVRQRIRYMERFQTLNENVARDQDWREVLNGFTLPVLSHELGQWWIYPDFGEIAKYNGVLRPTTLETLRDFAKQNGTLAQNAAFHRSSGALAAELYKEDIERQLRTPNLGGFQLLDLHDYTGQSCSLVGMLDAFWESKHIVTAEEFKRFCSPTVVLARLPRQEYEFGDTLRAPIEVAHYGPTALLSD